MKKLPAIEKQLPAQKGEIILYQPDETLSLEVQLEDDTVWLTQQQMAELFQRDQSVIARHIRNIYKEEELAMEGSYAKFAYMGQGGLRSYEVMHDRFLIIDDEVYAFGASLKDAGKKLFAYIKMNETTAAELLSRIR